MAGIWKVWRPATAACASVLLEGLKYSLSQGGAQPPASCLLCVGLLAVQPEQVGCSIVAAYCPLQATWSSVAREDLLLKYPVGALSS